MPTNTPPAPEWDYLAENCTPERLKTLVHERAQLKKENALLRATIAQAHCDCGMATDAAGMVDGEPRCHAHDCIVHVLTQAPDEGT